MGLYYSIVHIYIHIYYIIKSIYHHIGERNRLLNHNSPIDYYAKHKDFTTKLIQVDKY